MSSYLEPYLNTGNSSDEIVVSIHTYLLFPIVPDVMKVLQQLFIFIQMLASKYLDLKFSHSKLSAHHRPAQRF